jgi:hypothetical protein
VKIELQKITIREVVENYRDNDEEGVLGYDGRLNIRPPYQREFVYQDQQRDAVIETIFKGFPLNVFYWVVNDNGHFEVLDGQQRTVSFSQFHNNDFSVMHNGHRKAFQNLPGDQQEKFLDYELMVYFCKGNDSDKLDWFKTINIAGAKLTDQELRNAVYTGPWLTHAKSVFSKTGGAAYALGEKYLTGKPIRQDYLETALKWISNGSIDDYMSQHQHDPNANELWTYFRNVIHWAEATFTTYRSEMKGIPWGPLYNSFRDELYDTDDLERQVTELMQDPDVTSRKGIYSYILTRDEKHLSIRQFNTSERRAAYERQKGKCYYGARCRTPGNANGERVFTIKEMEADHITPWSKGGKTIAENCQMLCVECNRHKSNV